MQNSESNANKSSRGNLFNQNVTQQLQQLLYRQKIKKFYLEPRYNYPSKEIEQFSPDGEITLLNDNIIVYDNTTTIRHDRLKGKLWDAYGVKEHFRAKEKEIKYYVIIPDDISAKELKNAIGEQEKLNNPEYYSSINDIITLTKLIAILDD